ncbi:urease accessory protein UreD [Mycobacterium sp.]|jgi:urease accessory protein|uniref:urease accessory protein UreD n=1 Tax=Mycobacterium sp. TaxID=1785 RepID=UPI002D31852F|nr:urease accessory protein UreD [Mycobacterium sp.]HZA09305.1 urease accessory protein UreD [Mycobacterium sp.]
MHSDVLIAAHPGRPACIECRGAVQARRTGPDTVHLVSAAAGPLGGDTIRMRVIVEAGARLRLRSVAASLALPGAASARSRTCWLLEVAGDLDLDPEPTVVAASARHHSDTRLQLTEAAVVRIRERAQIGRSGEREGFWSSSLHADVGPAPLLRHRVELGAGSLTDDEIAAPTAHVGEFRYPAAETEPAGVTLALARGGCLSSWQGARLA